MLQVKRVPMRG